MQQLLILRSHFLSSPVGSDEDAAGSLRSEVGWTGREEDEQLLHHGADVGGRHQRQREVQRAAAETGQRVVGSVAPASTGTVLTAEGRQQRRTTSTFFITIIVAKKTKVVNIITVTAQLILCWRRTGVNITSCITFVHLQPIFQQRHQHPMLLAAILATCKYSIACCTDAGVTLANA